MSVDFKALNEATYSYPAFGINVNGIDSIVATLNGLPEKLAKGALVRACKKAGEPILQTAKDLAPVRYGFLRDSLISKAGRAKNGTDFYCIIGVEKGLPRIPLDTVSRGKRRGYTTYAIPAKYVHFMEFGSSKREATPFLRPALAQEAVNAVDIFETQINIELDKAVLNQLDETEGAAAEAAYNAKFGK
jgi:HK97 gp10 family phage protein